MIKRVSNLLTVKSIVTILMTLLFCGLAWRGSIPQEVQHIYITIIAFYFGTQHEKKAQEGAGE